MLKVILTMHLRYFILAFLCSSFTLLAQKPLSIGDTIPDMVFKNLLNHSTTSTSLSEFKRKIVILDFWATWCTSCLHALPKMDSLQSEFNDDLKVLLVNTKNTGDDLSKVQGFLAGYKTRIGKELKLITIVGDTTTNQLFPHQLLPHYVWISKSGRVIATTSTEEITARNIRDLLDGVPPPFVMKKDQNTERPLFSNDDMPSDNLLNYAVLAKGWFEGLPSGSRIRRRDGIVYGRAMANTGLLDMYKIVARGIDSSIVDKQIVAMVDDSVKLFAPFSRNERDAWYKENAYTLDVIVPESQADQLSIKMLSILNQYSGYTGTFEERMLKCWVLLKKSPTITFISKGGKTQNRLSDKNKPSLTNGNLSMLVSYINNLPEISELVLDDTGFDGKIDLELTGSFSDLQSIQEKLSKKGLVLKSSERMVKVFVISKRKEW